MLQDLCEPAVSIRLNKSTDEEWSDMQSSHGKEAFKLKCFRCFGTSTRQCSECNGSEMVANTHPLAMLFNEVLMRKLNITKNDYQKEEGQVYIIKEEEEQPEEKRQGCQICIRQCSCASFQKELYSGKSCVKWIDQDPTKTVLENCLEKKTSAKKCQNCQAKIENLYSICKTCEGNGLQFWICDVCSDNGSYLHPYDHLIEPVIDYEDNKIETISQEYEEQERDQGSFGILEEVIKLDKKNSSIANYLTEEIGNLQITNSGETNSKPSEHSRIAFEIDEGLFSSYQLKKSEKQITRPSNHFIPKPTKGKRFANAAKENLGEEISQPGYVFADYKCDYCDVQPILNVRYHCNNCEDFDLCENCYEECDTVHEHDSFEKIDGRMFREKAREKAMEKLFQCRDTNLNRDNLKATFIPAPIRKLQKRNTFHFNSESFASEANGTH